VLLRGSVAVVQHLGLLLLCVFGQLRDPLFHCHRFVGAGVAEHHPVLLDLGGAARKDATRPLVATFPFAAPEQAAGANPEG